jgi:hypothetical protein
MLQIGRAELKRVPMLAERSKRIRDKQEALEGKSKVQAKL